MRLELLLLGSLALPVAMFAGHVVSYRAMRAAGRRPTAHASALVGILVSMVTAAALVGIAGWSAGAPASLVIAQLAYLAGASAAMAILYLDVVNIAETSLHMHMLLRVAWGETTSLPALIEQYSPEHMVEERLQRLTGLGQVRREGDGFFVRDHSVLRIAAGLDIWKRVLKLPTSPDEAGA